nr:MAG TPA_asm: hypothetical protein [Caudoviricetes sp.]
MNINSSTRVHSYVQNNLGILLKYPAHSLHLTIIPLQFGSPVMSLLRFDNDTQVP